jgi:hypothetical protein
MTPKTPKAPKVDYRQIMRQMSDTELVTLLNYVEHAIHEAMPVFKALRDEILRRNKKKEVEQILRRNKRKKAE